MRVAILVIALICLLFARGVTQGQAPPQLQFEVASVRAVGPRERGARAIEGSQSGGPGTADPGRIIYSKLPLDLIIQDAFGVQWDRIAGPDWIFFEEYDIAANVPKATTHEQAMQMLQNLLAERLQLAVHRGTKIDQGYELTLAPGGPKLKASIVDENAPVPPVPSDPPPNVDRNGFPILRPGEHMAARRSLGQTHATFADITIAEFGKFIGTTLSSAAMKNVPGPSMLSRGAPPPVMDKTGLRGKYDFTLLFPGQGSYAPSQLPRIVSEFGSALEKQLGLKLKEAKVQVDTLVIDHVEKIPTEN